MPTYTYSYPTNFPNGLDIAQLHGEVDASGVVDDCDHINWTGSVVDVVFTPTLSGGQVTILDAVIAAHVPTPQVDAAADCCLDTLILTTEGTVVYSGDGDVSTTTDI